MKWTVGIAVLVLAFLLPGCPSVCQQIDTRCFEGNPQVCDARGHWRELMDCSAVSERGEGTWTCQEVEDGHTCLSF